MNQVIEVIKSGLFYFDAMFTLPILLFACAVVLIYDNIKRGLRCVFMH